MLKRGVFFSSRIEIHRFIKGKLPEKSRCKILSARFPKTQFSWYFFILVFICIFQETVNQYKYRVLWALEYVLLKAKYPLGGTVYSLPDKPLVSQWEYLFGSCRLIFGELMLLVSFFNQLYIETVLSAPWLIFGHLFSYFLSVLWTNSAFGWPERH